MTLAIDTHGLTRRFGRRVAVDALALQVPTGAICGLIGPNGAGKTTTIKLLMNLLRPSTGSAQVLGTDSRQLGPRDFQRIGYVSENQRLPDWMTPAELLAYCRPLYPAWDDALCASLQTSLDLPLDAPIRTLSRGTQMKAALLASLAYRPELVVLDEPFSGLDPLVRDELIRALLESASEGGPTVLISSHDIEEVERLADWIAFVIDGRLVCVERVASLLTRFRLLEFVSETDGPPALTAPDGCITHELTGRTLRCVVATYKPENLPALQAVNPAAAIRVAPLSLREIFVVLARKPASAARVRSS